MVQQATTSRQAPSDACPFRRPFASEFQGCGGYQPTRFVGLDTGHEPIGAVWTCFNLELGTWPQTRHRFYARCRIGDARARADWAATVRRDRLEAMRPLQEELGILTQELGGRLWAAKARQVAAAAVGRVDAPETRDLRAAAVDFLSAVDGFLEERGERLVSLGFPLDACRQLFADILEAWIAHPAAEPPEIADATIARFPEEVRGLLRPGTGGGAEATPSAAEAG